MASRVFRQTPKCFCTQAEASHQQKLCRQGVRAILPCNGFWLHVPTNSKDEVARNQLKMLNLIRMYAIAYTIENGSSLWHYKEDRGSDHTPHLKTSTSDSARSWICDSDRLHMSFIATLPSCRKQREDECFEGLQLSY